MLDTTRADPDDLLGQRIIRAIRREKRALQRRQRLPVILTAAVAVLVALAGSYGLGRAMAPQLPVLSAAGGQTVLATGADGATHTPVVTRLGCLRGVATLTAFALAVEIGDWHRLTGRSIGAYLGLVPTESSSGASRSQGSITKTGNGHARRLLIEAAWHHRPPNRIGAELRRRQDAADPATRHRAQQANQRLHARWVRFDARGKRTVIANTAIARELAGWCWSLAVLD